LTFYRYGKQKIRLVLLLGSISAARRPTLFFCKLLPVLPVFCC